MHFHWECVSLSLEIHLFIAVTPTAERADPQQDRLLLNLANKQFVTQPADVSVAQVKGNLWTPFFFALLLALSARKVNARYRQLTRPVAGGTELGPWGSAKTKAFVCWATVLATVQQFQTTDYLIACLDFSNDFTYLFDDLYPSLCFWQVPLWTKSCWSIACEDFTINYTWIFGTYVRFTLYLVVHKI